jgi:HSP20 family protein
MRTFLDRQKQEAGLAVNPFPFMRRLTEEMDRAFGLGPSFFGPAWPETSAWVPPIEVFERDHTFFIRTELPGLTREDVKVAVGHDEVTIEGERKAETTDKKEGIYRTERSYGGFYRRIALPEHVKAEAAKATFKNGMLEIEIPTLPVPQIEKRTLEIQE